MGARGRVVGAIALLVAACGSDSPAVDAGAISDARTADASRDANVMSPTLSLNEPDDSDEVFGAVRVVATLVDGVAPSVSFYVDDTTPSQLVGQATNALDGVFVFTWFTAETANGAHTLIATASAGEVTVEASVEVDIQNRARIDLIPIDAIKQTPATDQHPPNLEPAFTAMFEDCVPLPGPVNTAGAEDAPYITSDGQELYTFFTPDASVPPNLQLVDRVTGIYRSVRDGDGWTEPERVFLNYYDDPALDGCETIFGDELWFCTIRAGIEREIDIYVAHRDGDHWVDWQTAGSRLNTELLVGELHIANGGDTIYYHSDLAGGQGGADIWVTRFDNGAWQNPVNLTPVNSQFTDGWPWVSVDGTQLWFTGGPAAPELFRSLYANGQWQAPEKVVSPFAGEATFDLDGNLYFTHHFYDDASQSIIDADIYVCMRKP